jgi:hypothetical protein
MEGAAHSIAFARQVKIPMNVAKDFVAADKAAGKHFAGPKGKGHGKRKKWRT